MSAVLLTTINARYVHAAAGLRYLLANLEELRPQAQIMEFVLGARPLDIAERLLAARPQVVGFGVYIWNVEEITRVVAVIKQIAPHVVIVVGGPEVSYEIDTQRVCQLADYVITGWGEVSFTRLCRALLAGERPSGRVIAGEQPPLAALVLPYEQYSDEDVRQRFVYVEASRGCPYKCEFCLSSLDKTAWAFDLDLFLAALARLHARGARHFRFVDRTFNLKVSASVRILEFFLERMDERLFVHFEVIPDHLPDKLMEAIARFPVGALQFEVGIQTWNTEVQALISRRQDNAAAAANLQWLRQHSNALIHADLIAGLPGEDLASFGSGFDRLYALRPHEIQVGILKRLRGTPIARHSQAFAMRYNPDPPYNVLATDRIGFEDMQRVARFARYWELVANSGRFRQTLPLLLENEPFARFMHFSDWLFATTQQTHAIALERLFDLLHQFLTQQLGVAETLVAAALRADYESTGARGKLEFIGQGEVTSSRRRAMQRASNRQARHG
jgi:radical SAM superfamily enzyme YgiQ (UPF0313 family)